VIHLYLVRRTLAVAMDRAGVAPVDAAPPLATQWMSTSAPIGALPSRVYGPLHMLSEPTSQDHLKRAGNGGLSRPGATFLSPGNPLSPGALLSGWQDLNSRPLDPQTWAICPLKSAKVRFPWSGPLAYVSERRRTPANAPPWLHAWLHSQDHYR